MEVDNPGPKNIKGDNSNKIIICAGPRVGGYILCDLTLISSFYLFLFLQGIPSFKS